MWATLWLACVLFVGSCYSQWTNGPLITNACQDMQTGLFGNPQTTPSPFTITISSSAYLPNVPMTVTITGSGTNQFTGFFLQARRSDNDFGSADYPLGTFSNVPFQTQLTNCPDGPSGNIVAQNGWAHSSFQPKTVETITWIPPSTNEGPIRFRATIMQNQNTYWTEVFSSNMTSSPIIYCPGEGTPGTIFASVDGTVRVPSPAVAGFTGATGFTYTYADGNPIPAISTIPYHTLLNLRNGFYSVTVTVNDQSSSRDCTFNVYAFAPGALTIACPPDRVVSSVNGVAQNLPLSTAEVRDQFGVRQPVTYLTSPKVNLSPTSPTTSTPIGSFNAGINYVYASALFGGQTMGCFYTVTVPSIECPPLTYASRTGQISIPRPITSNLNGAITYTYSQPSGNQLLGTLSSLDPYHTLQNVDAGLQSMTVTATDTSTVPATSAQCSFLVYSNVPASQSLPTLICQDQVFYSSTPNLNVVGATIIPSSIAVTQTTSPNVPNFNVQSNGLTGTSTITGQFNPGLTIAFAYGTQGQYTTSCIYTIMRFVPSIQCPTFTYASRTGELYVSQPTATDFNGGVTFQYTQPSGNPIIFTNPQSSTAHLLQNVDGGVPQSLTVTASDAFGNTASCLLAVYAFVPVSIPIPTLNCNDQTIQATASSSTFQGPTVTPANLPIEFDTSPPVANFNGQSNPLTGSSIVSGTFQTGLTIVLVHATQQPVAGQPQYTVSCAFTVTVNDAPPPSLTCPNSGQIISATTDVSWNQPIPNNFPAGSSVQISYMVNGQPLFPDIPPRTNAQGMPIYRFTAGTSTLVVVLASDGVNTATCIFTVYVLDVQCPPDATITSNSHTWTNPTTSGFPDTPRITYTIGGVQILPSQTTSSLSTYSPFTQGQSTTVAVTAQHTQSGTAVQCSFEVVYPESADINCPQPIVSSSPQVSWTVPTPTGLPGGQIITSYSQIIQGTNFQIQPTVANNVATYSFTPGTTNIVQVTARDALGNEASCIFTVNVWQMTCPADIVELTSSSSPSVSVDLPIPMTAGFSTSPTIQYLINGNTLSSTNGQLTYPFSLGTSTTVMALASDSSGSAPVICTYDVYVPDITCPGAVSSSTTSVSFDRAIASGYPSATTITYTMINGQTVQSIPVPLTGQPTHTFPTGTSTVTATAVDANQNSLSCSFMVVVATSPPTIACPNNMQMESTVALPVRFPVVVATDTTTGAQLGVSYTYSRQVTGETITPTEVIANFPTGETTVTVLSEPNVNGDRAICDFTVTVTGLICPVGPIAASTPSASWGRPSPVGFPDIQDISYRYLLLTPQQVDITPTQNPDGTLGYDSFVSGTTTLMSIASDSAGNLASCQFTVDYSPMAPVITCPPGQFISSTTPAPVTFNPSISAFDFNGVPMDPDMINLFGSQNVINLNVNSGTFNLGVTDVIASTVTDVNGLRDDCSFTITVLGLQCPDPINSNIATAEWNAPVPLGFNGGLVGITYSYNGGGFTPTDLGNGRLRYTNFPTGQTTSVRATASHSSGNVATCVFPVTVADPVAPVATCPDNQVSATPQVFFTPATAQDILGNNVAISSYVASPATALNTASIPFSGNFQPGRTTITVTTEQDSNGLSNQCTFTISVLDLQCPVVNNVQSSVVTWNSPVAIGFPNVDNVIIAYTDASNGNPLFPAPTLLPTGQYQYQFNPGTTMSVRATASDSAGNTITCDFVVTTPPADIICPAGPFTIMSNELQVDGPMVTGFGSSALVTYTSNGRQLGTFIAGTPRIVLIGFELGVNLIRAEVTDGLGNSDFCEFPVVVERPLYGPWGAWSECFTVATTCQQTRERVCIDPNPVDNIQCDGLPFEQRECPFGSCGVATWENWSAWSQCSLTCSTGANVGTRSRTRTCNDPIPGDADTCSGNSLETEQCNTNPCVEWTQWTPWTDCSVPCNGGLRTRERTCRDETGQEHPSSLCGTGNREEIEQCNLHTCPPDPVWLPWAQWTDCSERCGGGIQERSRICSDPIPSDSIRCEGQVDASGIQNDVRPCNVEDCPEPEWSQWGVWSDCSATCNRGFRWRTRDCIDPFPDDTNICEGTNTDSEVCNDIICPVATWEQWGEWGGCSATCGSAVRTRYRDCDDVNPNDLDTCQGSGSTSESCYSQPCPFPVWQQWSFWSTCTATCGGGARERRRVCDDTDGDPATYCSGPDYDTVTCNTLQCLEAIWTAWSSWGICSETCGSGLRTRQRTCQDPSPGQTCPGFPTDSQSCFIQQCIEPVWLQWGEWAACSRTCGEEGIRQRFRICSHPDQNQCTVPGVSEGEETSRCNDFPCVEPYHEQWNAWGQCSKTCGGGEQTRTRLCRDPNTLDDKRCEGADEEKRNCNQHACPQSQWTDWSEWSGCSVPCNGGVRQRSRTCYKTGPLAPECPGGGDQVESCNLQRCPAYWGDWGEWGSCSTTCGNGNQRRERSCVDPIQADGFTCILDTDGYGSFQTRPCNLEPCVGWNTWLPWSDCSSTCGGGTRTRFRTCQKPNPFDPDCEGGNSDIHPEPCGTNPCPQWNEWNSYGVCSVTCGGGTRQRVRTCYDPDRTDTATCKGESVGVDPAPCSIEPCDGNVAAWSGWSAWTGCSQSCDLGLQQRVRTCYDPDLSDGATCTNGDRSDSRVCNIQDCVHPAWNEWQPWSCSVTCGGGSRARFRTCIDPDINDEETCLGQNIEQDPFPCNTQECPVPHWAQWTSWLSCSVSCGGGSRQRIRECVVPEGLPLGSFCSGGEDRQPDAQPCNPQDCPVIIPPLWNQWGAWTTCTVTCGGGVRERARECVDPDPSDFILCDGAGSERDPILCNADACPPPPAWQQWGTWGQCSRLCGGGDRVRTRTCEDPVPNDGFFCNTGSSIESQGCNDMDCAAWSAWNSWNQCTVDCGGGMRRRERTCNRIDTSTASRCTGDDFETTDCNPDSCPSDGPSVALIIGLAAAGALLVAIIAAIVCLICCRRASKTTVVYQDEPLPPVYPPTPSPPRSPPRQRKNVDQLELLDRPRPRSEVRYVSRREPPRRAIIVENPYAVRDARIVRPAYDQGVGGLGYYPQGGAPNLVPDYNGGYRSNYM